MRRKEIGSQGERIAQDFLKEKGYRLLDTNFRSREGEIDIIARKGKCIVFIEVRTRSNQSFGTPEESITSTKKERLVRLALAYLQDHPSPSSDWRIDMVAIELDGKKVTRVELIENAVQGPP
ncbi:YraN family protein [Chloroflexota bacterium]